MSRIKRRAWAAAAIGLVLAACSGGVPATTAPAPTDGLASDLVEGRFDIGGYSLWLRCDGVGSPTVVMEAGLGSGGAAWDAVAPDLVAESRVCTYDRAGRGQSDRRKGSPPTSAGAMADELARLLEAAHEPGPFVVVGHSYGGMIIRLFAARHPAAVEGIVFVDAASEHQFEQEWDPNSTEWRDGTWTVDRETSTAELAAVDSLGVIPIIVLTQGQMTGPYESLWAVYQDELASLSTDALHMVARDAGHGIQDDAPALVIEAVSALLEAVRSGTQLPACDAHFVTVGAECLDTTMADRLATWDVLRSSVVPTAGELPSGVYRAELTGDQSAAVSGKPEDFDLGVFTWTISGGRWHLSFSFDGATPEETGDVYAATGNEVTFRIASEHKVPGTPGVNVFEWTVDADGTLHLQQIDDELPDAWFTVPLVRVGDAPGG